MFRYMRLDNMATIYYIDSENVGDTWIELLDSLENTDSRFIVFYTGHSPRISYPQAIQLMNVPNKPEFIACHEGNNGLDFQLVTYLGYEVRDNNSNEMIIVSNDTGFDAVVLFWKERGITIKRVTRSNNSNSQPTANTAPPVSDDETVTGSSSVEVAEKVSGISKKELYTIINCIGIGSPSSIHLAFVHFYGNKNGVNIYKYMKNEKFAVPTVQWTKETKMKKLIELIITHSDIANNSYPDSLTDFIIKNIVDDKKTMSDKMNKTFGSQGPKLNKIFKPFYKTLAKIKKK